MSVILASQSPRRRELLGLFPFPFTVQVADIDETMDPQDAPYDQVAQVSCRKAMAIPRQPEDVVIAADTVVVCDGYVFGKPHTKEEAAQMLSRLSGKAHQVMTGLCVPADPGTDPRLCGHRRTYGQGRRLRHPGRCGSVCGEAGGGLL